jgi:hypothetical protein
MDNFISAFNIKPTAIDQVVQLSTELAEKGAYKHAVRTQAIMQRQTMKRKRDQEHVSLIDIPIIYAYATFCSDNLFL